jgi:hypothetical protein
MISENQDTLPSAGEDKQQRTDDMLDMELKTVLNELAIELDNHDFF